MKRILAQYSCGGGVHLRYHKDKTASASIEVMPLPAWFSVCMSQHLGAPARPVVGKGDIVARGQVIGESAGFVSAPVHAPTSGKVIGVETKCSLSGQPATFVDIESDNEDRWAEGVKPRPFWRELEGKALLEIIASAGIVGMGGAGFPAHVKLSPPPSKPIDTLIINGAECEPYLSADHRLMVEEPERVWAGVEIVRRILNPRRTVVAIEDNKPDAIAAFERIACDASAELAVLKTGYPQGAEKQLIYAVTGRETPSGGLPMDIGALVQNVGTCAAIFDAVVEGRPLIERVLTVAGDLVGTPKNLRARIGTAFTDLVESCGGLADDTERRPGKIICGGPMMGLAQSSLEAAVTKTTSGVLFLPRSALAVFSSMPCIACGRCVRACPMSLLPCSLSEMIEAEDYAGAESENVADCIECGSCAYECPAHRPLVQHMRLAKAAITARRLEREARIKTK